MSEPIAADAPLHAIASRMKRKVCLVTGGGSGIGRAAAVKMAEEGTMPASRNGARPSNNRAAPFMTRYSTPMCVPSSSAFAINCR